MSWVVLLAGIVIFYVSWIVESLGVTYAKLLGLYVPDNGPMDGLIIFLCSMMIPGGMALVGLAVGMFMKKPLIECSKPVCIMTLAWVTFSYGVTWPMLGMVVALCIYYLRHPWKTNGKNAIIIVCLVIAVAELAFVARDVARNGFGENFVLFGNGLRFIYGGY